MELGAMQAREALTSVFEKPITTEDMDTDLAGAGGLLIFLDLVSLDGSPRACFPAPDCGG